MLEETGFCVFPNASELSEIINYIQCPEENCKEVFHNSPNLNLHLQKRHGKTVEAKPCRPKYAQFYCPEKGCKYCFNPDVTKANPKFSNRYFTQFRYLKQHYIKVHMVKPFICVKCNKRFPTELHRTRHDEECGSKYTCSCGIEYSSVSALKTHALRKHHSISLANSGKSKERSRAAQAQSAEKDAHNHEKKDCNAATISKSTLPKGASILVLHGVVKLNQLSDSNLFHLVKLDSHSQTAETGSQTENCTTLKRKKSSSPTKSAEKSMKKRMSQQTQTGEKNPKKSSETQTMGQFTKEAKIKGTARKRKKSMETQTLVKAETHKASAQQLCMETQTLVKAETHKAQQLCDKLHTESPKSPNVNDYKMCQIPEKMDMNMIEHEKITERRPVLDEESTSSESENFKKHDICLPQLWMSNENSKEVDSKDNMSNSLLGRKADDRSLCLYQDSNSSDRNYTSLCHIETQTDNRVNNFLDDYLTNCETQTNDILDQDTRWTQTCDDTFLPELVDFTNNETQTAWSFSYNSPLSSSISLVHSETQTPPHVHEFNISQL